jgi:hypothetical protein
MKINLMNYFIFAVDAGRNNRVNMLLYNAILKIVGSCWPLNTKTVEIADAANIECVGWGEYFQRPLPSYLTVHRLYPK